MDRRDIFLVQWVLLLLSVGVTSALKCYNTGFFRLNSAYDTNRKLLLSSLSSNVTAEGGFFNASIGQGPNRIYAVALCREGYNAGACARCVHTVGQGLIQSCPNQTEAFSWKGDNDVSCMVRYSNQSFLGSLQTAPDDTVYNTGDITSHITQFDQIWQALMLRVLNRASAGNSSLRVKYYAVEIRPLTYFQNIYAFMQCTPDISPADCGSCLRESVGYYQSCCHGKQGGAVARPSCFFRWDLFPFYGAFNDLTSSPPPSPDEPKGTTKRDNRSISSGTIMAIVVPIVVVLVLVAIGFAVCRRRKSYQAVEESSKTNDPQSIRFDLSTVWAATDGFSEDNKLGRGGFGAVFKGKLANGKEIAVKRLSVDSGQGELEFKNEVTLLAGLRHRNLIKLLGFCLEGQERLLVYEFVPNSSLDPFLFDLNKRSLLMWGTRYKIIGGIAQGLLCLHEDSRLRIIQRNLTTSNVLLDAEMNPKISNFAIARLFEGDETQRETSKAMGTYRYMDPEYKRHGQFSIKSDVYSFGILVLEIITGQKNSSFGDGLPAHAWKLWSKGRGLDLLDPVIINGLRSEIMRCIHIGLLCVQVNVARRPTMKSIVLWLRSESTSLPVPTSPTVLTYSSSHTDTSSSLQYKSSTSDQSKDKAGPFSWNEVSVIELEPR